MQKLIAALAFAVGVSTAAFAQYSPIQPDSNPTQTSLAAQPADTPAMFHLRQKG